MKKRNFIYLILIIFIAAAVSGCGTVPKKFKEEVSEIKTRVETLETKVEGVETKQQEVERAASEQGQAISELRARKERTVDTNISVKPKRSAQSKELIKDIQTCLKSAGFYDGKIDGIKGKRTKRAIKEFQRANGLRVDGIVGAKTWQLLSEYLNRSAQGAAAGASEGEASK